VAQLLVMLLITDKTGFMCLANLRRPFHSYKIIQLP